MNLLSVVNDVAQRLKLYESIHAMWLEGSWATGKNNVHSDIDVWLDIDDGTFDTAINNFRGELAKVNKIDREESRGMYSTNPKLVKHTFYLKGFSNEQRVEVDFQEHNRNFVFNKDEHTIFVLFNKDKTIKWTDS